MYPSAALNDNPTPTCRGDHLIPDVLVAIFDFLDLYALLRCMKTCRRWRSVSRDHPTFSRHIYLRSLAPRPYSLFLAQILHKERSGGALWLRMSFLDPPYAISRRLQDILKRVWPRVVFFSIEARDVDSVLAILSVPSPRLEVLEFVARSRTSRGDVPQLTSAFLGGHAPVLRSLMTVLVLIPSTPQLAVLANVTKFYAGGHDFPSLRNIPLQFPRLQALDIVDSIIVAPLPKNALERLGAIPHITLQFRLAPEWAPHLINALPLSAIRRLSIQIPQGPHERGRVRAELLHALILSMPGDLSVVTHTALSSASPLYNFIVTSKDSSGREFRRDIGLGVHIPHFEVPRSICERIVLLEIHAPDWDRTCVWQHGLQRLATFNVVFTDEALFRNLLRRERTFTRRPVPMTYLRTTHVIVDVGKVCDVDYECLLWFLSKGTIRPCEHPNGQRFRTFGLRCRGAAELLQAVV